MPPPLIDVRRRPAVLLAIAAATALVVALSIIEFHSSTNPFDSWVLRKAIAHIGATGRSALFALVSPVVWLGLTIVVVVLAAMAGRRDIVLLAIAGPGLALVTSEYVLKPIVGRAVSGIGRAFPSTHETGVSAIALVFLIAACELRFRRSARAGVALVLALWVLLAAVGLIRNFDHYATDTIGAIGVSTAVVLGTALAIDRWLPH